MSPVSEQGHGDPTSAADPNADVQSALSRHTPLPAMGKLVAGDDASYRYLAESIRMHPGQEELKRLMQESGFGHVDYHNMTGGIAALHVGIKC
jgi:ubiquinone/menaquinone biosynthesis C-methylase UbiE